MNISKRELKNLLSYAFSCGVVRGYGHEHTENLDTQEERDFNEFYNEILDSKYRLKQSEGDRHGMENN